MEIMRTEHPKPQFMRKNWLNLNGQWQFEIDNGKSAAERELFKDGVSLSGSINVPFCPESELSGVGHKDFMYGVVYKREFELTDEQAKSCVKLHFGAVDYLTKVYINEVPAGEHAGGYISFSFDITKLIRPGKNSITVIAEDDTRNPMIPCGKQCEKYNSANCNYTRTTGIWQTVWLEFLPETHIEKIKFYPNINDSSVTVEAFLCGKGEFKADFLFENRAVGSYETVSGGGRITFTVKLSEKHLWEVGKGNLYTVLLTYNDDRVESYFGLREVRLDGYKFLINGKSVFQRLVLDQGFYPEGIYTAPTDDALLNDIKLSKAMGFNGARLHEKIFEERFLYHCDKEGYIVWGEYPDWGLDLSAEESIYAILPEWMEEIERDFNHPAIIGWCPHNETWDHKGRKQYDKSVSMLYDVTKAIDSTRPCIDTSGNYHVKTDIFDVHDYDQNPATFKEHYDRLVNEGVLHDRFEKRQKYNGEPTFMSEYGGIGWNISENGWGYGNGPKTKEEFIERFRGLTEVLLKNSRMFGLCYTQLTDVEQEQNGLYTYHREPKFPPETIRAVLSEKASIEDE